MAKPKPAIPNVVVSVQMPEPLRNSLEALAEERGLKFAELIRKLLGDVILRHDRKAVQPAAKKS